jgi:hypothetical protein
MKNLFILPTEKPSRLLLSGFGTLFLTPPMEFKSSDKYQNIYITSDEEIKGDWCYDEYNKVVFKNTGAGTPGASKKIILTTDQDLIADGVQSIDNKFLEWFVKNPSCEKVKVSELRFFNPDTNESAHCKWEYDLPQEEPKQTKWEKLNKELDDALEEAFGTSPSNILDFENAKLVLREHLIANKEEVVKDLEQMREWSNTNKQETLEEAAENRYVQGVYVINGIDICEASRECFIAGANYQAEKMYSEQEVIELLNNFRIYSYNHGCGSSEFLEWFEQFKKK